MLMRTVRRACLQQPTRLRAISKHKALSFSSSPSSAESIIDKCLALRSSMQGLNDKYKGPLEKSAQKNTILPFVFLLGNHSSGKSSFINYVLQRKVQVAGVAPTDDTFTIIVPGPSDVDRDGPAFIGDPDMGFSGLRSFGPQLIHHTQLKVRCNTAVGDFMIVDTPGMIDSPMVRSSSLSSIGGRQAAMDRGYDFENVCRWYAERADVILLFFDPDKPGTTGETLSILTSSLVGLDHKLHIILNKADQFRKIHDFARAYGSLCWNLSKVIQRKDLPRIYTMCLPPNYHAVSSGDQSEEGQSLGQGIIDLEATREEVVAEVFNAPKRRVDNEVSRLADSMSLLHMYIKIIDDIHSRYRKGVFRFRASLAFSALVTVSLPASMVTLGMPVDLAGAALIAGCTVTGAMNWWKQRAAEDIAHRLITREAVESTFRRLYARKIAEKDEFTMSLWARIADYMTIGLSGAELQAFTRISAAEVQELDRIIEVEVPNLRRAAGPNFNRTAKAL